MINKDIEDQYSQLEELLTNAQTSQEKIDIINYLAWELRSARDERALILAQKAGKLSTSEEFALKPYNMGLAASLITCAYINSRQGKFDITLEQCFQSLALLDSETPNRKVIDNLWLIGWVYYFLGDHSNALSYGLKALDLSKAGNIKDQEASVLDSLAVIHAASGDFEQSFQEYSNALRITREIKDEKLESRVLNNRAYILLEQGDYASALELASQSLEIARRLDLGEQQGDVSDTLGQILIKMGEYNRAEQLLQETLSVNIHLNKELGQAYCLLNLGGLYLIQLDLVRAETHLHQALDVATRINARPIKLECYASLTRLVEQQEDWKQAHAYQKAFHETYEEIHNEASSKRLAILKVAHQVETARRDAEIYHLRNEELSREIEERKRAEAALQELAITDSLSGLFNRRYLLEFAKILFSNAVRYHRPLSAFIIDIDHFKQVNDTYGHAVGDEATNSLLTAFARQSVQQISRPVLAEMNLLFYYQKRMNLEPPRSPKIFASIWTKIQLILKN